MVRNSPSWMGENYNKPKKPLPPPTLPTASTPNTVTSTPNPATASGLYNRIGNQASHYLDDYYNDYVAKMNYAGLSPLSKESMYAKYAPSGEINFASVAAAYGKEIGAVLIDKVEALRKQAHDWNPALPFEAYKGATVYSV